MNSYNTVNAAYRVAGLEAREGVSHGRDWHEVESFRLDLRAHGREAAAVGNTDDPFHWENRREGAFNPIIERDFQKMVTHAAAYGGTVTRAAYSAKVRESQEQGTRLLGTGGVAAAAAGGTSQPKFMLRYVPETKKYEVIKPGSPSWVGPSFGNLFWAHLTVTAWKFGISPAAYGRAQHIDMSGYTLA